MTPQTRRRVEYTAEFASLLTQLASNQVRLERAVRTLIIVVCVSVPVSIIIALIALLR